MIAVRGGVLASLYFLDTFERKPFRLTSFFGFDGSCDASYSWIKALAISEHARMKRSFSGGMLRSSFDGNPLLVWTGMVMV